MVDYIEFSKKIKEKYPEYKDVDDLTLAQKIVEKYPEYKERVTFKEITKENKKTPVQIEQLKKIDITPSGLLNNSVDAIVAGIETPIRAVKDGQNLQDAFRSSLGAQKQSRLEQREKHPVLEGAQDFAIDLLGYGKLPLMSGKGAFIKNALIQGGIPGAAEAMKRGGSAQGGAAMGTTIASLLQTIPYVGKGLGALGSKGLILSGKLAQLEPQTIQQAIKPTSKALDLTKNEADRMALDTTERFRNSYNQLLNKKGDTVGNLLKELPEDKAFKADELSNLYDSILNSYSLSKNPALNPARNAISKELGKIEDLLYGDGTQRFDEFSQKLKDLEFPKSYLDVVKNRYKNTYNTKVLDNLNNDIVFAERNFNKNIIDKLRKNPEILQNPEAIAELEKEVGRYANFADDELNSQFYNKFYDAVGKGDILEKKNTLINPKELYDINKNINNMIDWDKPGTALKNDVLEQMYLANAKKISDLSPELKQANKAYSDLMDYKGGRSRLRTILNPNTDIETATSKLKNYKSTNDNIFNLEKQLIAENNAEPFLSEIDDINAALDILKRENTGLGGLSGITKTLLTKPILKAVRGANRMDLKGKVNNIKELLKPIGKTSPALGAKAGANLLYGGVEYNDYQ